MSSVNPLDTPNQGISHIILSIHETPIELAMGVLNIFHSRLLIRTAEEVPLFTAGPSIDTSKNNVIQLNKPGTLCLFYRIIQGDIRCMRNLRKTIAG